MELKKLYKRSTTGKISEWQIFVEGDKFYTVSGFSDGLKITSDKTLCESKSYCTAAEQAIKQATAIHKKKMELGAFENIKDIDKPTLFKPMLAHDYDDYKDKIKFPLATQPKLDGVRCIIKSDGMWSRNGKEIIK
jgi:ATP-dependent DNA ligase